MNKFTTEELELMFELLAFNRECQDDNLANGEITDEQYEANATLVQSCLEKLAAN